MIEPRNRKCGAVYGHLLEEEPRCLHRTIFPVMTHAFRAVFFLLALAGFLPQMGASAAACRSRMTGQAMKGMAHMSHGAAEQMKGGDPCTEPGSSSACSTMTPCVALYSDPSQREKDVEPLLLSGPLTMTIHRPASRTLLPEIPPPRA